MKRPYVDHYLFANLRSTDGELNSYHMHGGVGTHVDDPDGWYIELVHSFVMFFVVPYSVVIILHGKVWIP